MNCKQLQNSHADCVECSRNSNLVAKDKKQKRSYRIENTLRKEVCKVALDGCYIDDSESKRCDFLFVVCANQDCYFVELKGKHLLEAVQQIEATITHFPAQLDGRIFARIVVSKVSHPQALETDARVTKLRKRLKQLGGNLIYTSGSHTDMI